ncbi:MAG: tetratricopeptide repeat protein, partial [Candidatus Poribacteria bacterium]
GYLNDAKQIVTLLHEIGHAIGLWGHSKDKNDVMYYASDKLHLSENDIATIKALYSYKNNQPIYELTIYAIKEDMDQNPMDADLHYLLGTVYLDQKNYTLGINSLKRCISLNPEYYKAHIALASAYKAIGQEESAISEYLELAKVKPSAIVYNVIGVSYFENGDFDQAIRHIKKALELDRIYEPAKRNLFKIYLASANNYINKKMYDKAVYILSEAIQTFPDRPEIPNLLGICYAETGNYEEALKQYELAIRINPGFEIAKRNMASCYNNYAVQLAKTGQWDSAASIYKKAIELSPDMENIKRNLSALYWDQAHHLVSIGKHKEALNAYIEFIRLNPENEDGYNNLGAVYSRLGDNRSAIIVLKQALKIAPNSEDIKTNLAIAHQRYGIELIQQRFYSLAIDEFHKSLEFLQNEPDIYALLAMAYEKMGKLDEASEYVDLAIKIDPNNETAKKIIWNIKIQQAENYIKAKNYDKALECYKSIPEGVSTPSLHDNIAYIYIMKGLYAQAIEELEIALKYDPYDSIANQNLISIESKLKLMLSRNSGSQEIKDDLARARISIAMSCVNRGDLMKAKQTLKSVYDLKPKDAEVLNLFNNACEKLANKLTKKGDKKEAKAVLSWQKK